MSSATLPAGMSRCATHDVVFQTGGTCPSCQDYFGLGTLEIYKPPQAELRRRVAELEHQMRQVLRLLDPTACTDFAHAESMMLRWGAVADRLSKEGK